jgi:hypothetical protein
MPYNGSGSYSLPAGNPVVTGSTISSTTHNNTMSDIASALTNAMTKDGQSTPTANLKMGGFKHTGAGAGSAATDSTNLGQVQGNAYCWLGTGGGTADVITASASPSLTAYAAGQVFRFLSSGANTTNVTLNIDSVGAKAVSKNGSTALAAGDIPSGALCEVVYDGTRFQLVGVVADRAKAGANSDITSLTGLTGPVNFAAAASVASATTVDLGAQGSNNVTITGTTTITSLGTAAAGIRRTVTAAGAFKLTHNATSLILPGGADITAATGDAMEFVSLGSGNWRCLSYQKANGKAVANPDQLSTASGSAPSYAARAWGMFTVSGGVVTLQASGNVASVTRNAAGDYTVTFSTAMADANYAAMANAMPNTGTSTTVSINMNATAAGGSSTPNASAFRFSTIQNNGTGFDPTYVYFAVFR